MPRKKPIKTDKPKKKKVIKAKGCDVEVVRKTFEEIAQIRGEVKPEDLDGIPRSELESMLTAVTELENRRLYNKIDTYYPDKGPLRRELYKPHIEFFRQGGQNKRIRTVLAANRVGKTEGIGAYEMACHLTGQYPDWWEGKRFKDPILAWTAGDTNLTTRNIQQKKLLGPPGQFGTGLLRKDTIFKTNAKSGVPDAVESVLIKHTSGGLSNLMFKSYEQKRIAFQGDEPEVIWLDEECPMAIYGECVIRTMTVDGIMMLTFTPLLGLSEVVETFMPDGIIPEVQDGSKFVINATWEDAPHLTEKDKKEILEETPIYLRDARAKGIPQLGVGVIYPILEEDIVCEDFEIPIWYPRAYALDVGWNATASLWGAWDRETDVVYVYSAYKQGHAEPATHVRAIQARGEWIPGCADPASRASSQKDGKNLFQEYLDLGLNLSLANNAVEAGIFAVWQRLVSGRLKIFRSCREFFSEFRLYHRDENGKVVKKNDHLMDCLRYLIMSGMGIAIEMPVDEMYGPPFTRHGFPKVANAGGADIHTGY